MESGKYSLWVSGKQLNWNTLTEAIIVWTLNLLSGKDSLNMSHIFWKLVKIESGYISGMYLILNRSN